jgi:hypothetical protein
MMESMRTHEADQPDIRETDAPLHLDANNELPARSTCSA